MKYTLILSLIAFVFIYTPVTSAQTTTYKTQDGKSNLVKTEDFGLGLKWGTLTGVGAKYWASEEHAWDITMAFQDGNTAVGVDHLWHLRKDVADMVESRISKNLAPYFGVGLISAFGSNTKFFNRNTENFGLAVRAPLGLEFLPTRTPLGIFAEIGLGFGFVPTNYTFITADLGARYYF